MYNFSMKVMRLRKGEEPINVMNATIADVEDEILQMTLEEDLCRDFKALSCYECQEEKDAMYEAILEIREDNNDIVNLRYELSIDSRTSLLRVMQKNRIYCDEYLRENPKSGFISGTLGEF